MLKEIYGRNVEHMIAFIFRDNSKKSISGSLQDYDDCKFRQKEVYLYDTSSFVRNIAIP